jgi:CHRD domain
LEGESTRGATFCKEDGGAAFNCRLLKEPQEMLTIRLCAALLAVIAAPAWAETTTFRAGLDGRGVTNQSGSAATASAVIIVDQAAQTVDIGMTVNGLTTDALWDRLVAAPVGPVHLHLYATGDLADANSSSLAFPVPYGAAFRPTTTGFSVATGPRSYAEGMATLGISTPFSDFLAAMKAGQIVLNIHTDAHNGGEISGQVVAEGQTPSPPAVYGKPADHSGHY